MVWAVTSLRHYLEGKKFLVPCDHRALQSIFRTDCTNTCLSRWRVRLSELDFDIEYKPGRQHAMADGLSRSPSNKGAGHHAYRPLYSHCLGGHSLSLSGGP